MRSAILLAVVAALFSISPTRNTHAESRTNQSGTGGFNQVRGKVYLPNGQSLDSPVEVELQSVFTSLKVYTDRGGSFVFQNLTAGSYTLVVNVGEEFEPAREYFVIDPDPPPPRGMSVRPTPKLVTIPIYLRQKRGVVLRNEVINAKWATVPKEAVQRLKRGVELAQAAKPAEAEAELRAAVQLAPTFSPAHTELGKLLAQTGKLEASRESFRTAIRHDQADFDAHLNLGIVHMNLKEYTEAEAELVTAAYINRTAVTPHYYIGLLYYVVKNNLDIAQKAFETAKELKGGRSLPAIHRYLGQIYMKKDMEKEALQELETYLKLAPKAQDAEKVKKDISDIKAKHTKNAFVERVYRDSVHNIIRLKTDSSEGQLISRLIDSAEFQRLRRVRQLGLADFAYQAAEHSRFTHSLGTFHLATRILAKLQTKYEISADDQTAVRVAALLHDLGHGAFSHVLETILGFHHEDFTIATVLSEETEVGKLLCEYSPDLAPRVADIIRGTFRPMALAQLVSSQLDVDRMDYLLRDSLMTGVKYGVFDLEWIIKSIEINEADDQLYVSARGLYAVEDYLQARYYMFRQVYFHRTLRAAEIILKAILRRALWLFQSDKAVWHAPGTAFEKILKGERLALKEHLELDDADVLYYIKQWQRSSDAILSDLCRRFLNRCLFKAFDLDMVEERRTEFVQEARSLVESRGFDTDYYFVEDRPGDIPHYFYTSDRSKPKNLIYVEDGFSRPRVREISEISSVVRGLQAEYSIHRVCFPAELTDDVGSLYHR